MLFDVLALFLLSLLQLRKNSNVFCGAFLTFLATKVYKLHGIIVRPTLLANVTDGKGTQTIVGQPQVLVKIRP